MTRAVPLTATMLLAACDGQGGSHPDAGRRGDGGRDDEAIPDYEDDFTCMAEPVGPDDTIHGFDQTARELLGDACTSLSGAIGPTALDATLTLELDYGELRHDVPAPDAGAAQACARLRAKANVTIRIVSGTDNIVEESDRAEVDLRGPDAILLAVAIFTVNEESPLHELIPTSGGEFVSTPEFAVWLTDLEADRVESEWRWRGNVRCESERCPPTTPGVPIEGPAGYGEVDWGSSALECQ